MPGRKDFFTIATRNFNHDARNAGSERNTNSDSLYDQLEKFGTPEEKDAVRKLKASGKISVKPSNFKINSWS